MPMVLFSHMATERAGWITQQGYPLTTQPRVGGDPAMDGGGMERVLYSMMKDGSNCMQAYVVVRALPSKAPWSGKSNALLGARSTGLRPFRLV